ncbi:MAG TPA: group I intron-associated PD-(D/E)XK endonuclease [Candidatus Sulfotelmatobacter sp.]|nr:group I intron-associated PD-(D/E)XK endonuclease [Candidatus Sulfotelmatobacter sp.]
MKIKHPKLRGEWVELKFMLRSIELGLHLNKPWGEVVPYDFTVEHHGKFLRVQVKSTMFVDRGGYSCTVRGSDGPYEGDPFDFLAAYIFQEDMWYIIPAQLVVGQGSIALYPEHERAKYGPYKEAWQLLQRASSQACRKERGKDGPPCKRRAPKRGKNGADIESEIVDCIHACVEEDSESVLWMSWLWRAVSGGAIGE